MESKSRTKVVDAINKIFAQNMSSIEDSFQNGLSKYSDKFVFSARWRDFSEKDSPKTIAKRLLQSTCLTIELQSNEVKITVNTRPLPWVYSLEAFMLKDGINLVEAVIKEMIKNSMKA